MLKIHTFQTKSGTFISISESEIREFKNRDCNQKGKLVVCRGRAMPFAGDVCLFIYSFSFQNFFKKVNSTKYCQTAFMGNILLECIPQKGKDNDTEQFELGAKEMLFYKYILLFSLLNMT